MFALMSVCMSVSDGHDIMRDIVTIASEAAHASARSSRLALLAQESNNSDF